MTKKGPAWETILEQIFKGIFMETNVGKVKTFVIKLFELDTADKKNEFVVKLLAGALLLMMLVSSFLIARILLDDRSNIQLLLISMILAGALGGIVNYFYSNANKDITSKELVPCVVVGVGASLLLPFLFSLTSSTLLSDPLNDVRYLTIISWSLLAGISGEPLISLMTSKFINSIGDDNSQKEVASLRITSTELSAGTVGLDYHAVLKAQGGTGPLNWSVTPPLPKGLDLKSNGEIIGTPIAATGGTLRFMVCDSRTPDPRVRATEFLLKINPKDSQRLELSGTSVQVATAANVDSNALNAEGTNGL